MHKLVTYISMSLDGFLATKDDGLNWLSIVDQKGEDYGYNAFTASVDKYIVGRKTYDVIMNLVGEFPQAKKFKCYIISRTKNGEEDGVTFYNGDIVALVNQLKSEGTKNIYCDGGGEILKLLMSKKLIDEFIISIIPVILGDGKRLFLGDVPYQGLALISAKPFESGLVQVHYRKKN
jgi:dihydrofolate reductase